MLNIGICDDGVNTCAFFEMMVQKYAKKKLLQVQVECWNSGETLKKALMNGNQIDVLFLDIEMYGLSGIDIGKYIRNQMDDHCMQIIYISGKSFHAKDLFQVQPMDFLEKPITDVQIEAALDFAVKLTGKWNGRFEYKVGKEYYYLPYRDILYFTSYGRMVRIMLADSQGDVKRNRENSLFSEDGNKIEFYGKMTDVLEKLPVGFQRIHHSYIINTMYVSRYQYDQVELVTGCVLPISKSYRKEVRHQLLQEG